MVQDQFREFSEMFQRFFSFLLGKHASRDPRSPGKMFRELLRLRNSWKISSRIISSCQRIQMEIIMIKTIQEYCLVFSLIKERTYRVIVMAEAYSEEGIHTPAILEDFLPDHDRTMTEPRPKTHLTDHLSSMSHFLFPIRGIWIFQFKAFFNKKLKLFRSEELQNRILLCTY